MDQRKTVLLADAGEEFRTLLWEEMEKTGSFLWRSRGMEMRF